MIAVIRGGREASADRVDDYETWNRIRERGIVVINTNPLRMFWLHDLVEWRINRSYQQAHLKS